MNKPRIDEWPRMTGGGMFVSKVIDDNTVELTNFWSRSLKVVAKVFRWKNELWCL